MDPNFDPDSYVHKGGQKRLDNQLRELEANSPDTGYISIIRTLHIQLLDLSGKRMEAEHKYSLAAHAHSFRERSLNQQVNKLQGYCSTFAADRNSLLEENLNLKGELAKTNHKRKTQDDSLKALYGVAADLLQEVDELKSTIALTKSAAQDSTINAREATSRKRKESDKTLISPVDTDLNPLHPLAATTVFPEPAKKKLKEFHPSPTNVQNVVLCTQCYAHGLKCDHGSPCQYCIKSKKACKRKKCSTYEAGENQCTNRHCFLAHPEDGYKNATQMPKARRERGLPPLGRISRW
ncbi:uncharacterized protein K460DRAFT_417157 [Cucurbitaria berberidis CBS 394.84]|uniref:Uncharacterized protein n=1 Tax=Cucurbitaria berberidis CBS 394.84 TaxID=1168544 RepID=A0A9P4GIA8_9PLEO|nr:uncharacterized protein K460DRAFT_417157 [Cucurbitaria berberidis CBS 394.84]KAF1845984.1 hypothetical protein K460DRAFT_417157 [Cucurbitaria berberidis CBS 394.84]